MSCLYETGQVTSTWILYLLCVLFCTRKFILTKLRTRDSNVSLEVLEDFEGELKSIVEEVQSVRETGEITRLQKVGEELAKLIENVRVQRQGQKEG
ncbi:WEB family protein chloroplastic-like [Dorcoceras hygrometricum]|uniref:WEB family protein chloroplastic-like n=1 Tax=Dorcoceras hygrometricum TaxID=472368 RepID=A0A2Z7BC86_9LAMI|nr:WEB family protein chloroplastic-like [Dorcoceras hygrometricum]